MIKNKMLRAEWKHLFSNKILLISMAVISFIPILYSGFFLGSIWDPYGQTKNLPVAFVNEDKGASLNGKSLNVGESVEKKLKDNHDLGWEFVSKQQADEGVNSGHFYAVVTIPSDFSQKAASITKSEPQQAVINFTTTPAKNYIGSLVSNQAAAKVKSSVSEQITKAYAKGILENLDKLGIGLDTAANGASTLHDGLGRLQSGTQTYVGGVNQLTPNAITAFNGYNSVRFANNQLLAGSTSLTNGLNEAKSGSQKLANGASLLESRSGALIDGTSQLASGADTLANKLADASNRIKIQPTGATTQQQIANPVKSEMTEKGNVPNYGYALSPYVLSLSLFVGALVLNVIYPIRKTFSEQESAIRWWLSKASVAGMAAFMQATILMLVMVFFLGLTPEHPAHFIGAIYLTSFAYMSIVSLLVIVLDNPGRFLAMVLLVLQLGSSEGTFPIQTANGFFQAINPLVPMTYSIRALRQAISGGLDNAFYGGSMWVLAGFLLVANLLTIGFFAYRGKRKFAHTSVDGDD